MKHRKSIAITLFLFVVLQVVSCKKGSTPTNLNTIKIASVIKAKGGGIFRYYISYDRYNNVDSIGIVGGGTDTGYTDYEKFTYVGSSFVVYDYENNASTIVDANTNGQIIKVSLADTALMTYNGSELVELYYMLSKEKYSYEWQNGDLVNFNLNGGAADTCYYDQSRNGQIGDALSIDLFLQYGRSYITTVHLPDELWYNGRWMEEDVYTFDNKGRINTLMRINASSTNDTTTYAYTYY